MSLSGKERVYLQLYDYETKEFSGLTTYHGLVRIYNSNTWPSRIFWSVVVLSCLSLFMIHSGYLLLGYHAKPTLFQVNTIVPNNGILFPDVTICNMNAISIPKIKQSNMTFQTLSYVLKFLTDVNNPDIGITKEDDHNYETYIENYFLKAGKSFDIADFIKTHSKQCEETFVACSFNGKRATNCCDWIVTELTEIGTCFRIANEITEHRQWYGGEGFGWEIVLNGNNEKKNDEKYSPDQGFFVMIHEHNKYPQVISHASSVSPNSMLHASIAMKNISLLDKNNWGTCTSNWNKTGTTKQYTSALCESMCKLEQIVSLCDCKPLMYTIRDMENNNKQFCTPSQISSCANKFEVMEKCNNNCDCGSECNLLEFSVTNSYTKIPDFVKQAVQKNISNIEKNLSVVSLFFRQISYERLEQQKQLQTADLLSNIAGSMGLFLGMSTVTLLEIFIYLFKSVWGTVNSARQKQFVEAVAEEERERQQSIVIIQSSMLQEDSEKKVIVSGKKEETKNSRNSIHIHLDRRNSRMVKGGDLFSAPRGSVAIPSQLLSPLSKHNRQILHTEAGSQSLAPLRRSSTAAPNSPQKQLDYSASESGGYSSRIDRKISTQSLFKSHLI